MTTDFDIAAHWEFANRGAAPADWVIGYYRTIRRPPPYDSPEQRLRAQQREWMDDKLRRFGWRRLLDAGCGNGLWFPLWREVDVQATALDRAGSAKHKVEAMARALHMEIPFRRAKIDAIPFHDNAFDVAVTVKVLQHTPSSEISASLTELGRVASYLMLLERGPDPEGRYPLREDTFDHDLVAIATGLGFSVLINEPFSDLQQFLVMRSGPMREAAARVTER